MSGLATAQAEERGCSSGVEHNLAKVGVEGSNPFARSNFPLGFQGISKTAFGRFFVEFPHETQNRPYVEGQTSQRRDLK